MHHVIDDDVTARVPVRKAHQLHATAAHQRGELILSGAPANPADGAVLLLQGDSPKFAVDFATADPYVVNGLITRWRVRGWLATVGDNASLRVDPNNLSRTLVNLRRWY